MTDAQGGQHELAVQDLLNSRKETIPWHVYNVGPDHAERRTWEHEMLLLAIGEKPKSVFCAYDTLGILTHLCLVVGQHATYHSTKDLYTFPKTPVARVTGDLVNMPPKHLFFNTKYDIILSTYLWGRVNAAEHGRRHTFLATVKKLMAWNGGRIVVSYCNDHIFPEADVEAVASEVGLMVVGIHKKLGKRGECGVAVLEVGVE